MVNDDGMADDHGQKECDKWLEGLGNRALQHMQRTANVEYINEC